MSLALPAAVLLLLVLPGFLAVEGFKGRFGRKSADPVGQGGLTWSWVLAFPLAAALHAFWCGVLVPRVGKQPDIGVALALLSGVSPDKGEWAIVRDTVVASDVAIFLYFASILLIPACLAVLLRRFVRWRRLDIRFASLRFGSPWQYMLSGETQLIDFLRESRVLRKMGALERIGTKRRMALVWKAPLVVITASVEVGEKTYIYAGFLKEWEVDAKGEPTWFRLGGARRREITDDRSSEGAAQGDSWKRFYPIAGFGVVLWSKDITSLNVVYQFVQSTVIAPAAGQITMGGSPPRVR